MCAGAVTMPGIRDYGETGLSKASKQYPRAQRNTS